LRYLRASGLAPLFAAAQGLFPARSTPNSNLTPSRHIEGKRDSMPQREKDPPTATASGVIRIVGPLEDGVITSIISTGATEAEVLEAVKWFTADDDLGPQVQRTRSGRVAQVYDILAAESQEDEELSVPLQNSV
jgi:hypothetical protein